MKILIFARPGDRHSLAVQEQLSKFNADVDYLSFDEFDGQGATSLTFNLPANRCIVERSAGNIDLSAYKSIWHRRPGIVKTQEYFEPWVAAMVRTETKAALDGVFPCTSCVWMNYPPNDLACRLKIWQLHLAAKVGLTIPETIVTNSPAKAREFYAACNGNVIYKLVGQTTNQAIPAEERPNGIPTLPLRASDLEYLDQVKHAPHFFQKKIAKKYDLRVTVVGHELFCICIHSQSGRAKLDWRLDYGVQMEPFTLPADIEAKCFSLMRLLGLNYGAIDIILNEQGEYVFIEINSAGQYLWIEKRTNLKISLAIANLLTGNTEPLVGLGRERVYEQTMSSSIADPEQTRNTS